MKKTALIIVSILCFGIISSSAQDRIGITKLQAKNFIEKTNGIIYDAQAKIKTHKIYSGDFTKAVVHQRYALNMFKQKKYTKALYHSHSARYYANQSINANMHSNIKLIIHLSEIEKGILIDNSDAGLMEHWQPSKTGTETQFTEMATHNVLKKEVDHADSNYNKNNDKILSTSKLNLQLQY